VAAADTDAAKLEQALLAEIAKVSDTGVTAAELEKVKNLRLMDFYRTLETINGKANTIGTFELFMGSYGKLFSAPEEYNKVTPQDIQRVASQYFIRANRTVGVLAAEEELDQ
jgi:predicted Zn-dependent peptidase